LASAVCDLPQSAAVRARRMIATLAEGLTEADLISRAGNCSSAGKITEFHVTIAKRQ
jgi:hypothetical protein